MTSATHAASSSRCVCAAFAGHSLQGGLLSSLWRGTPGVQVDSSIFNDAQKEGLPLREGCKPLFLVFKVCVRMCAHVCVLSLWRGR